MRPLLPLLLLLCAWLPARGSEVSGVVRLEASADAGVPSGEPVVVYLTGFEQPPPATSSTNTSLVIAQKNKTFVPSLRVVVAGQTVQFTNDDDVVHNVFSASTSRPFDLGKPHPGQTREVTFVKPGLVEVYCNIHEQMSATVLVLPNRAFAIAGPDGRFVLPDVPPGRHPLHVWGRHLEPFAAEVVVPPDRPVRVELTVHTRLFTPAHLDKYGQPYRPQRGYTP